ncbi:MAG: energy transducer TonB [Verrucomicrobiales bacterium]|jgi:protein TonB|nr:energy transducer TonB [Verrucomicrobiales bacterium]
MNYSVLKVSVMAQTASLALHAAVIVGGGLLFLQPAQFGMDNGQGGATGLASRQILQAEVQLNDLHSSTTNRTVDKNDATDELSPVPDPDADVTVNTTPAASAAQGVNSNDFPVSQVTEYRPADEKPSVGSPGTLTAKMFAAGNGGAKTAAQPVYLHNPPPSYPTSARERSQEGRVLLRVSIGVDGAVSGIKVQRTSGYPVLDDAALAAVRKWVFSPATIGGVKVEDTIDLPIVFSLKK